MVADTVMAIWAAAGVATITAGAADAVTIRFGTAAGPITAITAGEPHRGPPGRSGAELTSEWRGSPFARWGKEHGWPVGIYACNRHYPRRVSGGIALAGESVRSLAGQSQTGAKQRAVGQEARGAAEAGRSGCGGKACFG